jgi:shikimate dehydrogenase
MPANYKAELVAVLGQPVAENPTSVMQEAAFAAAGLNWRYLTIEVPPEKLADAIRGMRAFGMRGINLTIPHKVAVMQHLDEISPEAAIIGAVNTVRREGDRLIGENTDGKGFLRALRVDAGIEPKGKRVLIFGAGGAARAVAAELALAGASSITVVNRSVERGRAMVADLRGTTGANMAFEPWRGTWSVAASDDLIVNATSIGLYPDAGAMPDVDFSGASPDALVADVVFNPPETTLLRAARRHGLRTLDGLSMLVYQGVIGFELWTGRKAPEQVMKRALAETLRVLSRSPVAPA